MERVSNVISLPEEKSPNIATHQLLLETFKDAATLEEERMDKFLADARELTDRNEQEMLGLLKELVEKSRMKTIWETVEMIDEAGEDGIADLDKEVFGLADLAESANSFSSSPGDKCPVGFGG